MKPTFRLVIAGSRGFTDYSLLRDRCDHFLRNKKDTHNVIIISGTAYGADTLGELYATDRGFGLEQYPANWLVNKKAAGIIRNKQMLNVADAVVVFWDGISRGTMNMINITEESGKPIRVVKYT